MYPKNIAISIFVRMKSSALKLVFIWFILGIPVSMLGQRANVLATYQLVENGKFKEAKKAIEEAIQDEKTEKWARTWYTRGYLCQEAYAKGKKDKKKEYCEIYPDQLYVAFNSYQKALSLKQGERIKEQLEPKYVSLANDFIQLGSESYKQKNYKEALKAYEHALAISQSEILTMEPDTALLYNTALAAYRGKETEKTLQYLEELNTLKYSPNVPHLLYKTHLSKGDTLAAKNTLKEGIEAYKDNEELVLLLVDLLYTSQEADEAIQVLENVKTRDSANVIFPFTKGLVYQKAEQYENAIEAYKEAIRIDTSKVEAYVNIGTCYFNIGVEIEEHARSIANNRKFQMEKAKATDARKAAVRYLEQALEKDADNQKARNLLVQLYQALHITDKLISLE